MAQSHYVAGSFLFQTYSPHLFDEFTIAKSNVKG